MVPVRESHCHLFIEMVGEMGVMNNKRSAQAVWVLPLSMRVVPIRACLVDLVKVVRADAKSIRTVRSLLERNR